MGTRIDETKMAAVRQEFLAGGTLRELAARHGISERTLAARSRADGWAETRRLQQTAAMMPALAAAADRRAEVVGDYWKDQVRLILNVTTGVAFRVAEMMRTTSLNNIDARDLTLMLKALTDIMTRLADLVEAKENRGDPITVILNLGGPQQREHEDDEKLDVIDVEPQS